MGEVIMPQQERAAEPEEINDLPEIVTPDEVISKIARLELGQLIIANEMINASDLTDAERVERVQQLDQIALNLTGSEASTFGYRFPDELIAVTRKEGYHEVDKIEKVGEHVFGFRLLSNGKILITRPDGVITLDQDSRNRNFAEDDKKTFPLSFDHMIRFLVSPADYSRIYTESNTLVFGNSETGEGYFAKKGDEIQFRGKHLVIKGHDGFYFCDFMPGAPTPIIGKKIFDMKAACDFQVFSDGKMIVAGGEKLMTFDLSDDGRITQTSSTTEAEMRALGIEDDDGHLFISGNEFATKTRQNQIVLWHLDEDRKWHPELLFTSKFPIKDFNILPDGTLIVLNDNLIIKQSPEDGGGIFELLISYASTNTRPRSLRVSPAGKIFVLFEKEEPGSEMYIKVYDGKPVEEENG